MCILSVVIPCYNQARFLDDCIESLQKQTMDKWEAIIVDDGSQDNFVETIARWEDPRISVIQNGTNLGVSVCRNIGFKASHSDLIFQLDADDYIKPECFEILSQALAKDPNLDVVFGDIELFGSGQGVWKSEVVPEIFMLDHQTIPGAANLMRKSLWDRSGGFCELDEFKYGNEDWDFWLSATEKGFQARRIPEVLYYYRRYEGSLSRKIKRKDYLLRELMYSRHQGLFDRYGMKRKFLSVGYIDSGLTCLKEKEVKKGLSLLLHGLVLYPRIIYLLKKFGHQIR